VELIKDLRQAISDSTKIPLEALQIYFSGESSLEAYLSASLPMNSVGESVDSASFEDGIKVKVVNLSLIINRKIDKSFRNSAYHRQLDLNVLFFLNQNEYQWQGRVSDDLSKSSLKRLLGEAFPNRIMGNYLDAQPAFRTVVLTTLGVFSFVAALFFMRT